MENIDSFDSFRKCNETVKKIFEEQALSREKVKKRGKYFGDIDDLKENINKLNLSLSVIKDVIRNEKLNYNLIINDNEDLIYKCIFNKNFHIEFDDIVSLINEAFSTNKKAFMKYADIIFPELNANEYTDIYDLKSMFNSVFIEVRIEKTRLNRIPMFDFQLDLGEKYRQHIDTIPLN